MAEGAVLLLVNERGDRRLLWELLDGEEFEAIYAAKDVSQARSMLAQDNDVALVVLEVGSGDADVRGFCDELAQDARTSGLPVLLVGVIEPAVLWPAGAPANVRGFLHSPVDADVALLQIQSAVAPAAEASADPAADDVAVAADDCAEEAVLREAEFAQQLVGDQVEAVAVVAVVAEQLADRRAVAAALRLAVGWGLG